MTETELQNRTYISLIFRGKDLNPQKVTDSIGINPSRSFKRGDLRKDNKNWPHGYWELESTSEIHSVDLITHLEWMIKKIEPSQYELIKIINSGNINAEISCFLILITGHESLTLSAEILSKLSAFGLQLNFDIYSSG